VQYGVIHTHNFLSSPVFVLEIPSRLRDNVFMGWAIALRKSPKLPATCHIMDVLETLCRIPGMKLIDRRNSDV
jgi:hypothetical protein